MADVRIISTKNRIYIRPMSDKGRDYLLGTFAGAEATIEEVSFNIEVLDDVVKVLKATNLDFEFL